MMANYCKRGGGGGITFKDFPIQLTRLWLAIELNTIDGFSCPPPPPGPFAYAERTLHSDYFQFVVSRQLIQGIVFGSLIHCKIIMSLP